MPKWRVELIGDEFDLEDLPDFLNGPQLSVTRDGESYLLLSERLEPLVESAAVHDEARALLPLVNAFAALRRTGHKPVSVGSRVEELTPEGTKRHAVVMVGSIGARGKVGAVTVSAGGEVVPQPIPEEKWAPLALRDEDVREALVLWGARPHNWMNLYKIYEVIEDRADIVGEGWATRAEIRTFKHTSGHPEVAGEESRHSRVDTQPPKKPMSPAVAEALIGRILKAWMDSLA